MKKIDDSFELFDLEVRVVGAADEFVCNHSKDVTMRFSGENMSIEGGDGQVSLYALASILPLIPVKQRATHPHDWITTDEEVACPDPFCGARFRIRRVGKRTFSHAEVTRVPLP